MLHTFYTAEITEADVESFRDARKAAIEAVVAIRKLNVELVSMPEATTTTLIQRHEELIRDMCERFDLLFELPAGSYWDEAHLTALSESEAHGEIQLHQNQLAYHDGDSDNDKSETEFAIKMITYLTTIHPNCYAR